MITLGAVHPRQSFIIRTEIGEATTEGANNGIIKYEVAIDKDGAPVIRSSATRKYFTLSWAEIINLAIIAGINKKE